MASLSSLKPAFKPNSQRIHDLGRVEDRKRIPMPGDALCGQVWVSRGKVRKCPLSAAFLGLLTLDEPPTKLTIQGPA